MFNSQMEILRYVEAEVLKGKIYSNSQLADIIYPIFMSPVAASDIEFLMTIHKIVEFKIGRDIFYAIGGQVNMDDKSLNLTQLHLLCGLRGPADIENFEFEVIRRMDDVMVQAYAKHKDFPEELKMQFYKEIGDTEFLPKEVQDAFVF